MKKLMIILLTLVSGVTYAESAFVDGPAIKGYGKHASVQQSYTLDKSAQYKVAFDIAEQGDSTKVNRKINSLARFINMHVANGVPLKNIKLALVAHGKAGFDLLSNAEYKKQFTQGNPNAELLSKLLENNVQILLCGQSAAYYNIKNKQLKKGVKMALSAMTAHAMLQNQGYTLNPF
jgi:intracellular sulfur oxidation DsrE/DsrF family protein